MEKYMERIPATPGDNSAPTQDVPSGTVEPTTADNVVQHRLEDRPAIQVSPLEAETSLIERFQHDVELAGLVGEKKNAAIVFLCSISAKLSRPLNLTVQGSSSAGKNHLIGTVARFIPDGMQKNLTGMTPKVLMHSAEDEFLHKVVYIVEYEGVAKADYAIRTMQSEQVIKWDFVDTRKGIEKKTNTVRGPAAFIQATTRPVLHPENETRLLFVQVDESEQQTEAILLQQAESSANGSALPPEALFQFWQKLIQGLQYGHVRIPFAPRLAESFPFKQVRSRRDFQKLLGLIEVSAFLHQHQREKAKNFLIANRHDYLIAKPLFEHSYGVGPERKIAELLQVAKEFQAEFTVADLLAKLDWGKSKTYEVLKRAEELGCIADTERGRYRFLRATESGSLNLPETVET